MAVCFICGKEIISENKSEEHILLNAIGGVLKSYDLICKSCNSNLGDKMDAILAKQLQPFAVLLNVSRDRGKTPHIIATRSTTGEQIRVLPGGIPELDKPSVQFKESDGKKRFEVIARSQQESTRIFNKIKKKYPTASISKTEDRTEYIDEKITVEFDLSGNGFMSVCKTAICYYLHIGGEQKHIQQLIDKFKSNDVLDYCNFCYLNKSVIVKSQTSICHSVSIVGDTKERLLYAYIELFDFYKVIVLLSDDYHGEEILNTYCYDLLRKTEIDADIELCLTRQGINGILSEQLPDYGNLFVRSLQTTLREIETKNAVDRVWCRIIERSQGEYPDGIPTEIFIPLFASEMSRELYSHLTPSNNRDKQE